MTTDVLIGPAQLGAILSECEESLRKLTHPHDKAEPKWLATHATRLGVKAARAVIAAADNGIGQWGDLPHILQWHRDPNREPIDLKIESADGTVRVLKVTKLAYGKGSEFNPDGSFSDGTALGFWVQFLCPFLRSHTKVLSSAAGAYDFPNVKTDDQGRILGQDGKPRPIVEKINPETGKSEGWHAQGREARVTDDYDATDTLEHLRCQVADWGDCCRVAAEIIRMGESTETPTKGSGGDVGDDPQPAGLDRNNVAVLFCLSNRAPALLTLDDIVVAAKVSRDTASKALGELIGDGLACRPKGERKGATVTDKGRNTAAQIRR